MGDKTLPILSLIGRTKSIHKHGEEEGGGVLKTIGPSVVGWAGRFDVSLIKVCEQETDTTPLWLEPSRTRMNLNNPNLNICIIVYKKGFWLCTIC